MSSARSFRFPGTLAIRENHSPDQRARHRIEALARRFRGHPGIRQVLDPFARAEESQSPSREREWLASRLCVALAVERLLNQAVPAERIRVSLSHCEDRSAAIGWDRTKLAGAGVDIEPANRALSARASNRIASPAERFLGLAPLELFCIKEACFKAAPADCNAILPDFQVTAHDPQAGAGSAVCSRLPGLRFDIRLAHLDDHVLALALIYRLSV